MSSYFNQTTVEQIISESLKLSDMLQSYENYLAHTPDEKLTGHTELTLKYLAAIVEANQLNPVIDRLIQGVLPNKEQTVCNWVKKIFIESISFHDFGKVNVNFQKLKMSNGLFTENEDSIGSKHSLLGAYIFVVYYLDLISKENISQEDKILLSGFCLLFSYAITNHHKSEFSIESSKNDFQKYIDEFIKYLKLYKFETDVRFEKQFFDHFERNLKQSTKYIIAQNHNEFNLWCLVKLQFSLLTAADYYATNHYKSNLQHVYNKEEFGIIDKELSQKMINNFATTKEHNRKLYLNPEYFLNIPLSELQDVSFENICTLRQKLGAEFIEGINKNKSERVFYLEAPTAAGKTNLSMLGISKLLELFGEEITKVFYVFPFTTLITQTHSALKETFKFTDNELIQIHSKAGFHSKEQEDKDGLFGKEKQNYVDYMFVNYPCCLLSHIKFFDVLKSNKKETNYILHRLTNSIVVIDELQSYSPSEWDKLKYFISNFAEKFNIRFIIMSATLPKIHSIATGLDIQFNPIIKDAQKRYLQNPNFKDRILFDFSLIDKYEAILISELTKEVLKESSKYSLEKGSVHTIIEFIHKKSTTEFYDSITQAKDEFTFDKVLVLSGTILEPRRKEIINFLKDDSNQNKNILLITTQVVEAGVDIDMDLGFKNISLLDSDEQLAGRINRNAKKEKCRLFLFKKDEPFRVYKNDMRYEFSKSLYKNKNDRKEILENKDFHLLYELVIEKINKTNKFDFTKNINDYIENVRNLQYGKVNDDFKLIDNDNVSFFVPIDIELNNLNGSNNFSETEYKLLLKDGCIKSNKVIGAKVWATYCSIVKNNKINFIVKAIDLKILGGIISQFTFSMFNNEKLIESIKPFLEYDENKSTYKICGYYCLSNDFESIYQYETGLNESQLNSGAMIF